MLARGELHTIGATTLDEYRKYIEKDAALERRFQPVDGQRADRRRHHQHPARAPRAVRDSSRRPHQGRGARGGGGAFAPLHHRSLPARQGDRSRRRSGVEAADGNRLDAGRARRDQPPRHAARDRARGAAERERQGLEGAAREAREGARRSQGRAHDADGALAAGEGSHSAPAQAQGRARAAAAWRSSARSAPAITAKRPSCSTAGCPSSSG